MNVFVGYDAREHVAWITCRHSILKRSSVGGLEVEPLRHMQLRSQKLFDRPWSILGSGQYLDERDGKPFSTEFSHSRFLVPEIARRRGMSGWVLFVDCDFLFLADVAELFALADPKYAVMCVKHQWDSALDGTKMDGMLQQGYDRKLWSSLVLWNLDHPKNERVTRYLVNTQTGRWMHGFLWLEDDEIGEIPTCWNWIPGLNDPIITPKAVHYSFGGPWMGYQDVPYAYLWYEELEDTLQSMVENGCTSICDHEIL